MATVETWCIHHHSSPCLLNLCDMTLSVISSWLLNMCHTHIIQSWRQKIQYDSFLRVIECIHTSGHDPVCNMTNSFVWHDFVRRSRALFLKLLPWFKDMCNVTYFCLQLDVFIFRDLVCNMTHKFVWHDFVRRSRALLLKSLPWFEDMFNMTSFCW